MKENINKRAAVVTGASKGIGAAIAIKLAEDGYPIVLNYLKSEEDAENVLKKINDIGANGFVCKCDVRDNEQVKALTEKAVEKFNGVDVLINNASDDIVNKSFSNLDWKDIENHINILIKGAFNTCKNIIPIMESQGAGKIINITSIYTDGVPPIKTYDYIIAKSGLSSFTKSLAVEYGVKGIKVNNISPGMTSTTLIKNISDKTKLVTQMQTPLRRIARVEDIANLVSLLAGNAGDFITGETIRVCGGQKMI